jgi:hypothetical protein
MITRPEEIAETSSMIVDSRLMEGYKIYANQINPYLTQKLSTK